MNLAGYLRMALDPAAFMAEAGTPPDDWQARFLRDPSRRILLNASRQSGKSTSTAARIAHTAIFTDNALCLALSPSLRQSGELFRKVGQVYRATGSLVRTTNETALTVQFANGSRVISLPSDERVRGFSGVSLLAIDEASRVPDALYLAVRPMLAVSDGTLIALSTPNGRVGFFHAAGVSDEPWSRYEVPAEMCPRISADFLAEERSAMTASHYAQEYECQFAATDAGVFDPEAVSDAIGDIAPLTLPSLSAWRSA